MYYLYSAFAGFTSGSLAWCWRQYKRLRSKGGVCGIYADEPPAGRWVRYTE